MNLKTLFSFSLLTFEKLFSISRELQDQVYLEQAKFKIVLLNIEEEEVSEWGFILLRPITA